jgi:hypothetical protein
MYTVEILLLKLYVHLLNSTCHHITTYIVCMVILKRKQLMRKCFFYNQANYVHIYVIVLLERFLKSDHLFCHVQHLLVQVTTQLIGLVTMLLRLQTSTDQFQVCFRLLSEQL